MATEYGLWTVHLENTAGPSESGTCSMDRTHRTICGMVFRNNAPKIERAAHIRPKFMEWRETCGPLQGLRFACLCGGPVLGLLSFIAVTSPPLPIGTTIATRNGHEIGSGFNNGLRHVQSMCE
ncbi:hypothetical protein B0T26DRAFT_800531 [Lasiosphaeria miniovina]|uniref:Uncharacterized protein n=1 Tax=Lasiosphaeria miniovina TaxID=1954250 RepID=A0AA40B751_9PEZI|nr:uncharacterized protein B0T26DRAFT_800531 [Lasiosphaeria miniovina]KAK0728895.1 hypothetical protein B0T26DRAFT_800531 [Lasiosphaeria miniovina]